MKPTNLNSTKQVHNIHTRNTLCARLQLQCVELIPMQKNRQNKGFICYTELKVKCSKNWSNSFSLSLSLSGNCLFNLFSFPGLYMSLFEIDIWFFSYFCTLCLLFGVMYMYFLVMPFRKLCYILAYVIYHVHVMFNDFVPR